MDSRCSGIGKHRARPGRTRLSIVYTGFLGDNENILFWVSQFLSEALRFCQRNPGRRAASPASCWTRRICTFRLELASRRPSRTAAEPTETCALGGASASCWRRSRRAILDYKSRDQITSWFIGRVREDTALRKLRGAFSAMSGIDPAQVLPHQSVGEFHLLQEGLVVPMKSKRSLIQADQVPFDRIEQLAFETKGQDQQQLKLAF